MPSQYNFHGPVNQSGIGDNATVNNFNASHPLVMSRYQELVEAVQDQGDFETQQVVTELSKEIAIPDRRPTALEKLAALTVAAGTGTAVAEAAQALIEAVRSLH